MPQYVGLEQQGFYKPFELLNQGITNFRDHKLRQAALDEQKRHSMVGEGLDTSRFGLEKDQFGNLVRHQTAEEQMQAERNKYLNAASQATTDEAAQKIGQQDTTFKQAQAERNFSLPPEAQGKFYSDLPPELRARVQAANPGLPESILAQRHNETAGAQVGHPYIPPTPPGLYLKGLTPKGPEYAGQPVGVPVTGPDGRPIQGLVSVNGEVRSVPGVGGEGYQQRQMYANVLDQAEQNINAVQGANPTFNPTGPVNAVMGNERVPRMARSDVQNQYHDSVAAGTSAIVYMLTGKVATQQEINNISKGFYPQYGDDAASIERKRQLREVVKQSGGNNPQLSAYVQALASGAPARPPGGAGSVQTAPKTPPGRGFFSSDEEIQAAEKRGEVRDGDLVTVLDPVTHAKRTARYRSPSAQAPGRISGPSPTVSAP